MIEREDEGLGYAISVGDMLKKIVSENNLSYGIDKVRIKQIWQKIGGEVVKNYTESVDLKADKLFIKLNNSALKNNLEYKKSDLINLINEEFGKKLITDIVFL